MAFPPALSATSKPRKFVMETLNPGNPIIVRCKTAEQPHSGFYQAHPHWVIGTVIHGAYRQDYLDGSMELKAGGIWWEGPWEPHNFRFLRAGTSIIALEFLPEALFGFPDLEQKPLLPFLPFLRPEVRSYLQPKDQEKKVILGFFRQIAEDFQAGNISPKTVLTLGLWQLLARIMSRRQLPPEFLPLPQKTAERILRAIIYIKENLARRITVKEAARQACLGLTQFSYHFRQVTGLSFIDYYNRSRLERVRYTILREGNIKLAALARQWGFYDGGHLQRLYKKHFGKTPSQERRTVAGPPKAA